MTGMWDATKVNGRAGDGTFFPELWNQKRPSGFKELGLSSMSLILLHHLLFHLDLRLGGTSYGERSHISVEIRATSSLLRRHHE
jgi:hypothetical protein